MASGATTTVFHSKRISLDFGSLRNFPLSSSSSRLQGRLLLYRCKRLVRGVSFRFFAVSAGESQSQYIHPSTPSFSTTSTTSTTRRGWTEFADKVSGEWDGYGADFSTEGVPIELPESVVPQAYRDWEVKVFDWQTQCPTLAHPTHFQLLYKLVRLLPTVGCEADAATPYNVLHRNINLATAATTTTTNNNNNNNNTPLTAFAYQSNGCYVAVWPKDRNGHGLTNRASLLVELEHCLVDPRDRESRVRIIQLVSIQRQADDVDDQPNPPVNMQLEGIQVFCEQWYGPFRNGEQLGGCAIRDSAFASTPALKSSLVTGVWQGLNAIATFRLDSRKENRNMYIRELLVDEDNVPKPHSRDGSNLILLPKQLWCSSHQEEEQQGKTCFQVGWLLDQGFAITSKCSFSADAKLTEIAVACETAS